MPLKISLALGSGIEFLNAKTLKTLIMSKLDEDQSKLSFLAGHNIRCNLKWVAKADIGLGEEERQNTFKTGWHYLSHFRRNI